MGIKLYRYRTFKKNWKEEAFDGIVEPSSPLYFNDPYDCGWYFGRMAKVFKAQSRRF